MGAPAAAGAMDRTSPSEIDRRLLPPEMELERRSFVVSTGSPACGDQPRGMGWQLRRKMSSLPHMRHSILRRIIGLLALLAIVALPLHAGMAVPMGAKVTAVTIAEGAHAPCGSCNSRPMKMTTSSCTVTCNSVIALPSVDVASHPALGAITGLSPVWIATGIQVSPEPYPPRLSFQA